MNDSDQGGGYSGSSISSSTAASGRYQSVPSAIAPTGTAAPF